jgi:purine-cytosine permease-like protein
MDVLVTADGREICKEVWLSVCIVLYKFSATKSIFFHQFLQTSDKFQQICAIIRCSNNFTFKRHFTDTWAPSNMYVAHTDNQPLYHTKTLSGKS